MCFDQEIKKVNQVIPSRNVRKLTITEPKQNAKIKTTIHGYPELRWFLHRRYFKSGKQKKKSDRLTEKKQKRNIRNTHAPDSSKIFRTFFSMFDVWFLGQVHFILFYLNLTKLNFFFRFPFDFQTNNIFDFPYFSFY